MLRGILSNKKKDSLNVMIKSNEVKESISKAMKDNMVNRMENESETLQHRYGLSIP